MEEFLGVIKIFAGNYAPEGWLMCQGQLLNIQQYQALYTILGTVYGGNGVSTFALPDYRGRVPMGTNTVASNTIPVISNGTTGGAESVVLNSGTMPAHNHTMQGTVQWPVNDAPANTDSPVGAYLAQPGTYMYLDSPGVDLGGHLPPNPSTSLTGATSIEPIDTMCPFLAVNYIICIAGDFPTQN